MSTLTLDAQNRVFSVSIRIDFFNHGAARHIFLLGIFLNDRFEMAMPHCLQTSLSCRVLSLTRMKVGPWLELKRDNRNQTDFWVL